MKGKVLFLMMICIVISYLLYQHNGDKRKGSKNDKTLTIQGVISGNSDDVPVSRATIELQDSRDRVLSDENGEFKIKARKGQKMFISHPYYKKKVVEVTGVQLDIKLYEKGENSENSLENKVKDDFPDAKVNE